uniref:NAD(P)H-quinone oxidoreductase subunit 6, chloroplastic n=1 Tax=Christella appendiculata TaxID=2023766 RepID=A0A248RA41_9MONI|nr:NADH-plastoquinone oxidoreductase subunit 6 [Christella appendiculata]YP_010312839.1 NADH-plastoquinone oxidoreductase subunit 6 [Christella dentata]ASU94336.1 NADH-plastoquinone oxidoreductase subunit 6 [Christella appendiculata]ULG04406.1 NADH-plastoquinone oxidoreductase subunit 6 [Christella dentata]
MNLSKLIHEFILSLIESGISLGSLGTVSFANVAHSAFSSGSVLTRISLSYFVLNADFVAAAQPLVYVGAINVLIVSAVMVTDKPRRSDSNTRGVGYFTVSGACAALFLVLVNTIHNTKWFDISFVNQSEILSSNTPRIDVHQLGYKLLGEFLIPFELLSILLLVALVGAINPARDEDIVTVGEKSSLSSSRKNSQSL